MRCESTSGDGDATATNLPNRTAVVATLLVAMNGVPICDVPVKPCRSLHTNVEGARVDVQPCSDDGARSSSTMVSGVGETAALMPHRSLITPSTRQCGYFMSRRAAEHQLTVSRSDSSGVGRPPVEMALGDPRSAPAACAHQGMTARWSDRNESRVPRRRYVLAVTPRDSTLGPCLDTMRLPNADEGGRT